MSIVEGCLPIDDRSGQNDQTKLTDPKNYRIDQNVDPLSVVLTNCANLACILVHKGVFCTGPSCSISHKISKSNSSGGEPVICDSAQHTTWVAYPTPTPTTNNTPTRCSQQTTQYLSTGIKRKNLKTNNLVEHIKLIMGGWVVTTRLAHLDYRE